MRRAFEQGKEYACEELLRSSELQPIEHDDMLDLDEFRFVFQQLPMPIKEFQKHNGHTRVYQYLEDLRGEAEHAKAYSLILNNFIKMGIRTIDLKNDTLRLIAAFGAKNSFFEEDQRMLMDFCRGVINIYNKHRQR